MAKNKHVNPEADMTVGEHLDELRKHIMKAGAVLVIFAIVLFLFKGIVIDAVFWPMQSNFPTNRFFAWMADLTGSDSLRINSAKVTLINTQMAGQFMIHIKSSLVGAIIIAFPYLIWQLWLFVRPALTDEIIDNSRRIVAMISLWFFAGFSFGYFLIAPLAVNFLVGYEVSASIDNMIAAGSCISTILGVSFAAALAFQLPVVVKILASAGMLKSATMRKNRKLMLVIFLIVSAIITPPDIVSLILVVIPLYGLFEYGIHMTQKIEKQREAKEKTELPVSA